MFKIRGDILDGFRMHDWQAIYNTAGTENVTQLCVLTNFYLHTEHALIGHSGHIRLESRKGDLLLYGFRD